jgi:hypothetical protein
LNNINLLPKKPLLHQIYLPLLYTMIIIFVGCGILLFLYSFSTNMHIDAEQKKVDQTKAQIIKLTAMHQVDPRTQDFNIFSVKINELKSGKRDWVPIFDLITTNLYKSSRLLTMKVDAKDLISADFQFASLKEVAFYSTLLKNSPYVEKVYSKEITQNKASKTLGSSSPNSSNASTIVYYSVSLDIQLKPLVKEK